MMRNLAQFPITLAEMADAAARAVEEHREKIDAMDPLCRPIGEVHGTALATLSERLKRDVEILKYAAAERRNLTNRLCGFYAIGPHLSNGDPEFGWRQFQGTPINREAAMEIDRLRRIITRIAGDAGCDDGEIDALLYTTEVSE